MDGFVDAFLGVLLGAVLMYWIYGLFNRKKRRELVKHQSTIILDRIKRVCKLVSVEGDFAEIYNYENYDKISLLHSSTITVSHLYLHLKSVHKICALITAIK